MSIKYCTGCQQNLSISLFGKNRSAKDGLQSYCAACKGLRAQKKRALSRTDLMTRECLFCHQTFVKNSNVQRFCSETCTTKYRRGSIGDRKCKAIDCENILIGTEVRSDALYCSSACTTRQRYKDAEDKSRYREYSFNRRARVLNSPGYEKVEEWLWQELCNWYDNKCINPHCQNPNGKLTKDHVIPLAKGGEHNILNLQPLCGPCNFKKHTNEIDYRDLNNDFAYCISYLHYSWLLIND